MADYIERGDGQLERVREAADGVPMSALDLTGGTSEGHAQRLLDVLAGRAPHPCECDEGGNVPHPRHRG